MHTYDAILSVSNFGESVQQYYPLVKTEVCLIMLLELLKLAGLMDKLIFLMLDNPNARAIQFVSFI